MGIKNDYSHTLRACYTAYITQAIAVNFAPLLFLTFQNTYGLSLQRISELIIFTFVIQLMVDFSSTKFVDKIGYRVCAVSAHLMSAAGFIMLGVFPDVFSDPFYGIVIACFFYSFGSGLIEVLVSPIVESCPTENKASAMAYLHSFYCWGTAIVIIVSTLFFAIFGIENWRIMSILWSIIPLANTVVFMLVPISSTEGESGNGGIRNLFRHRIIWVIVLLMLASGAAELAMSQWASAFAESGLKVSKTVGDLAGPCMFAIMMGLGRVMYSIFAKRVDVIKYMSVSAAVCVIAYLMAALSVNPVIALLGCALTGLSVGVFWPGTFSYASKKCPDGGAAMFGILAFAGDSGCTLGPALVGFVSGAFGDSLKAGILFSASFPLVLLVIGILLILLKKKH